MSNIKTILLAIALMTGAVLAWPQGESTRVLSMKSLIGLCTPAPQATPAGWSELFFNINNGCHASRIDSSGAVVDLEAVGGSGGVSDSDLLFDDDFIVTGLVTTSDTALEQTVGLGWTAFRFGTGGQVARYGPFDTDADHPGIISLAKPSAANTGIAIWDNLDIIGSLYASKNFDLKIWMKGFSYNANTEAWCGLTDTPDTWPNNGLYGYYIRSNNLTWYAISGDLFGTGTPTSLGGSNLNWNKFRLRRISSTQIGFTLNANSEVVLPDDAGASIYGMHCGIRGTAASDPQSFQLDRWRLHIPLTR